MTAVCERVGTQTDAHETTTRELEKKFMPSISMKNAKAMLGMAYLLTAK